MRYAIGIDVGGTKIAGGLVDLATGQVQLRRRCMTRPYRGAEAVLDEVRRMAGELVEQSVRAGTPAAAIGVGVCELVDTQGNVASAQTIDWRGVPVQANLAELAPATVESDVRAAALAEARYGAGQGLGSFAYVTVGTGISSTFVQAGVPWAGARGVAITLGSMPLTTRCDRCGALLNPVLEEIASGLGIVAVYNRRSTKPAAQAEEVLAAAQAGEPLAVEVVIGAGECLGNSVAFLVNVLDPEAVVVGGGLGMAGGLFWESFVSATRSHIYADSARDLSIRQATLGVDAGIIGAAAATQPGRRE